jgi:hypothetical protein
LSPVRFNTDPAKAEYSVSSQALAIVPGSRRRISFLLVVPALLVGIFATAVPVALVVYIWRNTLSLDRWHAVIVLETRPWALTISQAGSHLILLTVGSTVSHTYNDLIETFR